MKMGIQVTCRSCHLPKKPVGRSAPLESANSWCDHECPGYYQEPYPGSLWPGETEEDFRYSISNNATKEINDE